MEQENKSVMGDMVENMGKLVILKLKPFGQQKTLEKLMLSNIKKLNCYIDPNIEIGYLHSLYMEKPDNIYIEFIPLSEDMHIPIFLSQIESCNGLMEIGIKKQNEDEYSLACYWVN